MSQRFLNFIHVYNLVQNVSSTTHVHGHTLDLVITRSDEQIVSDFIISNPHISDHLAVQCKLLLTKPRPTKTFVSSRNLRSVDLDDFSRDLENSDLFKSYHHMDVSALIDSYNNTVSLLLNTHAPLKQRSILVRPCTPWFTPDILKAKRKRRKLERKWRTSKSDLNHQQYTEQCRIVNELVRDAKENYFSSFIENSDGDQRTLFRSIDLLLNRKPESRFPTCSSDHQLVENFNNFLLIKLRLFVLRLLLMVTQLVFLVSRFDGDAAPTCD